MSALQDLTRLRIERAGIAAQLQAIDAEMARLERLAEKELPPEERLDFDGYVSAADIAKRFGLKKSLVYRLAREGKIPCLEFGPNTLRFDPKAVAAALPKKTSTASANEEPPEIEIKPKGKGRGARG